MIQAAIGLETSQSYLGQLALWYSRLSMLMKGLIGLSSATSGACIGILFNTVLFGAIIATILYAVCASILLQHVRGMELDTTLLNNQLREKEIKLVQHIAEFEAAKAPLNQLIGTLKMQTTQQAQDTLHFSTTVQDVSIQSQSFEISQQTLLDTQQSLSQTNDHLAESTQQLNLINTELRKDQQTTSACITSLTESNEAIKEYLVTLTNTTSDIIQNTQQLAELNAEFSALNELMTKNYSHIKPYVVSLSTSDTYLEQETALEKQETCEELTSKTLENIRGICSVLNNQGPELTPFLRSL